MINFDHYGLMGGHVAATWRILLNHPSTAAMRLITNYFHHLSSLDTPTDGRSLRAEYCIVGIEHKTAI